MDWHRTGAKPLPEPMMTQFIDEYMCHWASMDHGCAMTWIMDMLWHFISQNSPLSCLPSYPPWELSCHVLLDADHWLCFLFWSGFACNNIKPRRDTSDGSGFHVAKGWRKRHVTSLCKQWKHMALKLTDFSKIFWRPNHNFLRTCVTNVIVQCSCTENTSLKFFI